MKEEDELAFKHRRKEEIRAQVSGPSEGWNSRSSVVQRDELKNLKKPDPNAAANYEADKARAAAWQDKMQDAKEKAHDLQKKVRGEGVYDAIDGEGEGDEEAPGDQTLLHPTKPSGRIHDEEEQEGEEEEEERPEEEEELPDNQAESRPTSRGSQGSGGKSKLGNSGAVGGDPDAT